MADTKISALTELTSLAADDEFVVVDKSDTGGMGASGTNKRVKFNRLMSGAMAVTNVKDPAYGATGDGTTDDTVAIQAALDAAGNNGTVLFPVGNYKVSNQGSGFCLDISARSSIVLQGMGHAGLNPSGEGGGACIFTTSASTTIIKSEAAALNHRGPTFSDLRIENRAASGIGLSIQDYNHYVIERCAFRGVGQAGSATSTGLKIYGVEDASYGRIEGCHFHRHLYGCVTDNSVGATFAGSCYFESNVTNHVLIDLQNTASAVVVVGAKFQCNHVTGAIAIRQGEADITAGGDVQFIANNFEGCTLGIQLQSRATLANTGTLIIGNSFVGTDSSETAITVGTNRRQDQIIGNRYVNLATGITDNGTDTLIIGGRAEQARPGEFLMAGGVFLGSGTGAPTASVPDGSVYFRSGTGVYTMRGSAWVLDVDATTRVDVRKNSTGSVLSRRRLNLIEGSGVTLTVADDSGDEEVDITIAASAGAGGVATDTIWETKGDFAVATGADTAERLAVGASLTHRLVPDSAVTTGLKWVPHIVRRTADSSPRTNSTFADDDMLLWPVGANEEWFCMAYLKISAANATMDFKAAFTCPSGGTVEAGVHGGGGSAMPTLSAVPAGSTNLAPVGSGSSIFTGGTPGNATLAGVSSAGLYCWLTNGATPGNGVLQWAQQTTDAGNLILKKNSFLQLTRLA